MHKQFHKKRKKNNKKEKKKEKKENMSTTRKIVTVNVGGRMYTACKTTFERSVLFRGAWTGRLSNTPLFVDRNPDAFFWILEILRTGIVPTKDDNLGMSFKYVEAEMKFFEVGPVAIEFEEKELKKEQN